MRWVIVRQAGARYDLAEVMGGSGPEGEYTVRASGLDYHNASLLVRLLNQKEKEA